MIIAIGYSQVYYAQRKKTEDMVSTICVTLHTNLCFCLWHKHQNLTCEFSRLRPTVSHVYQPDKVGLSTYISAFGCEHSICSKNICNYW